VTLGWLRADTRCYLVAVFLLALLLRVGFVLTYDGGKLRYDRWYASDAETYVGYAESLAERGEYDWLGFPARRAPLYPWLIAGVRAAGGSLVTVRIVQAILGAATCLCAYGLARELWDRRVGYLAAGLVAVYYPLIQSCGYIMSEALYTLLLSVALLLATMGLRRDRLHLLAAAGFVLGASALCREVSVPVAVLATAAIAVAAKRPLRRRLGRAAVFAGLAACAVLPWTARNYAVLSAFVPISASSGHTLYIGNNDHTTGGTGGAWTLDDTEYPAEEVVGAPFFTVEADAKLRRMALDYIKSHPKRTATLAGRKFVNMWRPYYAKASTAGKAITAAMYVPAMLLALAGLATSWRNWRDQAVVLAALATFALVHVVSIAEIRYRYPVMPAILCYSAAGAFLLLGRIKKRRAQRGAPISTKTRNENA